MLLRQAEWTKGRDVDVVVGRRVPAAKGVLDDAGPSGVSTVQLAPREIGY